MFIKQISPSLSPNTEADDIRLARLLLFSPSKWRKGTSIQSVENWFKKFFSVNNVFTTNSGRSALYLLLKSANIGQGDEVIVQAFTCVAVPEVVMWVKARPIYVDIAEGTYNIDIKDLQRKITKNTKAIIVQHTFGIPADIIAIKNLADKYNILLIEDCAHSLGATIKRRKIGTYGDVAFFSFGRDKIISSVFGGVLVLGSTDYAKRLTASVENEYDKLQYPSKFWIFQQIMHPILFSIILPLYNAWGLGKILLVLSQRLKLLSVPVTFEEYKGRKPNIFPARLPNGLAMLAYLQLSKLYRYNVKRILIAREYGKIIKGAVYLRYPIQIENPDVLCSKAKKRGMLLGKWYSNIIDPVKVDLSCVFYKKGSCPVAENVSKHILNLPTHPLMKTSDVKRIKNIL